MKVIADAANGRDNNFNLLRMVAATAVMFSHSWPIVLGTGVVEPLQSETGYSLGIISVFVFFAVSGFFITKSFDRRRSLIDFLTARFVRLYPALIVVLTLTVLILGLLFSSLPPHDFFIRPHSWTYIPANLSLRFGQHDLPGVFANNPYGSGINGSLWTLFYEVACYGMVVLVGLTGILRAGRFASFVIIFVLAQLYLHWGQSHEIQNNFARLSLPFVVGMACYVWQSRIPLSAFVLLGLTALTVLTGRSWVYYMIFPITVAYAALWIGLSNVPVARKYNALGDYSYGIYIYAFPVQQATIFVLGAMSPWLLAAMAFPITLTFAVLSWTFIENPTLIGRVHLSNCIIAIKRRLAKP